jgi:hypothetical protein
LTPNLLSSLHHSDCWDDRVFDTIKTHIFQWIRRIRSRCESPPTIQSGWQGETTTQAHNKSPAGLSNSNNNKGCEAGEQKKGRPPRESSCGKREPYAFFCLVSRKYGFWWKYIAKLLFSNSVTFFLLLFFIVNLFYYFHWIT